MLKSRITDKQTKFVTHITVKVTCNKLALKILRAHFSNNYLIEKV